MNDKISREWATPLTIGVFALMAATGLLMFFHLDNGVQKTVHEWAGWLMVAGVALHVSVHWLGFKRYWRLGQRGAPLIGACLLVLAGSFAANLASGGEGDASPPALAIGALTRAPIAAVAPLFGKSAAQARAELAAAGIPLAGDAAPLSSALGGDREKLGLALRTLAKKG